MNKRLPLSLLLIAALFTIVCGSTYAFFSSTASNEGNTFNAGTVICRVQNDGTGANAPLYNSAIDGEFYPESGEVFKTLRVINDGTLPSKINGFSATFSGDTLLANGLSIKIDEVHTDNGYYTYTLYSGPFSGLAGDGITVAGTQTILPNGGSVDLSVTIWMPTDSGDEYQDLDMIADISATIQQLTS